MKGYQEPIVKTFESQKNGPCLLVLGAIHGNEICGPHAINKVIKDIESKRIIIEKGSVIFVPVCNPAAYRKRKCFVDENLNRVFKVWVSPNTYEKKIANYLTKLVHKCDVLLDIHSVSARSVPTVFIDYPNKKILSFAKILGVSYILQGWQNVYRYSEIKKKPYDTVLFAKSLSKNGLTLECGQHKNKKSKEVAYRSIINALHYLEIAKGETQPKNLIEITMKKIFIKKDREDSFCKDWSNFDVFKRGDVLAIRKNGKKITAEFDGVMIMPSSNAEVGTEWFYIGTNKKSSSQ